MGHDEVSPGRAAMTAAYPIIYTHPNGKLRHVYDEHFVLQEDDRGWLLLPRRVAVKPRFRGRRRAW